MIARLTDEQLRIEYRNDPDLLALMDEHDALRVRVAELEAALRDLIARLEEIADAIKPKYARSAPKDAPQ